MKSIQSVYSIKSVGPPEYYLDNDYKENKEHDPPTVAGDHPKLDDLTILDDREPQKYQILIACPRMEQ
eukprot:13024380-Ditylum_brightwellii.AAC.2